MPLDIMLSLSFLSKTKTTRIIYFGRTLARAVVIHALNFTGSRLDSRKAMVRRRVSFTFRICPAGPYTNLTNCGMTQA